MTDKDGNLVWFGNYTSWGRLKADYFKMENNSPRIRSKLSVKYGGDPNCAGSVMIDGLPNREAALAWEKAQVRAYRAANNGARPPKQYRP